MDRQTDFLLNISVLYRSTQKYYDRMLQSIQLTYAQLPILIMIFEQEGITMRQIAESGVYDKGTISKNVKHLEQEGYILIQPSKQDKRNKELYTTDYAKQNMSKVYAVRRDWWQHLIQSIDQKQFEQFVGSYEIMAKKQEQYGNSSISNQAQMKSPFLIGKKSVLNIIPINFRPYYIWAEVTFVLPLIPIQSWFLSKKA